MNKPTNKDLDDKINKLIKKRKTKIIIKLGHIQFAIPLPSISKSLAILSTVMTIVTSIHQLRVKERPELIATEIEELKSLIKYVSICENKPVHHIYAEFKKRYNVYDLKKLPISKYQALKRQLEKRKCKLPNE